MQTASVEGSYGDLIIVVAMPGYYLPQYPHEAGLDKTVDG